MITKIYKYLRLCLVCCGFPAALTACSDLLYEDSDQVIYADDSHLNNDADTLWSVAGIINKMQVIADRTILLGEMRGDLADITDNASADLRQLAYFNIATDNKYNNPRDYYAIINNCNYFIAKVDTALRNNRNEYIFMKEYAAVKAFRAWTYLQLVLNYGTVPLVTDPILTKDDSERDYPHYGIHDICQYFIADIAPYADVETPSYGSIRNTDSKLFYFPIYVLLGDLNLWAGNYRAAAENYYKYISTRNGPNSAYPLSTSAVRFNGNDTHWLSTSDTWSSPAFDYENSSSTSELITMIPGDSIPSEGNYSQLRDLWNTTDNNQYQESITPSQAIIHLSAAQKYCHYTSGGQFVFSPEGLTGHRTGDLRLQAVYSAYDYGSPLTLNGKTVTRYVQNLKHSSRNVHIYRRAMVYLRMAEALNRAGFPRFAFQILKRGLNNSVIQSEVIPYYPDDEAWLRTFDFPNVSYQLETTAGQSTENTIGLHSRGSGYTPWNTAYEMPHDQSLTGPALLDFQIDQVENLIIDEEALEFAFEGHRFYDLMRVALRRGDPAYLATRVYRRRGAGQTATMQSLIQSDLTDVRTWYLNWNGQIGLGL